MFDKNTPQGQSGRDASRRGFLRASARGAAGLALTYAAGASALENSHKSLNIRSYAPDRRLRLINGHTWEKLDVVYWTHGVYIDESLEQISYLMRDHRAGKQRPIDLQLLDDMHRLYNSLDTDERIHVLSGYRTPETNAKLRKRSKGVAKYSLHMEAKAADIHIPGVPTRTLQKAALAMKAGGVGYYGRSGFVHIDTGRVRMWENG